MRVIRYLFEVCWDTLFENKSQRKSDKFFVLTTKFFPEQNFTWLFSREFFPKEFEPIFIFKKLFYVLCTKFIIITMFFLVHQRESTGLRAKGLKFPPELYTRLFFFIRNLCGRVEAEVPYFLKMFEPHSSLLVLYF